MNMLVAPSRFGNIAPADIYWDKTTLLLSGNGTNGSLVFTDESFQDRGDALNGTGVSVDTSPTAKFGTGVILFDGVNDRLAYYPSEHFFFKNGAFTVEGRFAFAAAGLSTDQLLLSQWEEAGNMRGWRLVYNASTDLLQFHVSTTGADTVVVASVSWSPIADQFYHIAVDRSGNDWRIYVDGVMLVKATSATTQFRCRNAYFRIGCNLNGSSANTMFFNGRCEEVRITKGVARYGNDAGFAPLTVPHSRQNGVPNIFAYPYTLAIKNPDAECSSGAATVPPRHWTTVAGTPQQAFNASGVGTQAFPDGFSWFYAGNTAGTATMRQDVALPTASNADVDAGVVRFVCGWVQSCETTDSQTVQVDFLNAALGIISSAGPGLMSDGGANNWMPKGFNVMVPALTRYIRFRHLSNRASGTSNDGYGDNISARIEKVPATPVNAGPSSDRWRIITNSLPFSDGFVRNNGGTNSRFSIADCEMTDTPGSADQCVGGTASASSQYSASFPAANAFDATLTDGWIKGNNASNDTAVAPHWLEYQFPAPVHVNSVKIRSRSSLDSGAGSGAPYNFDVQYWNGSAWVTSWSCTTERFWGQNEQRQFDRPI